MQRLFSKVLAGTLLSSLLGGCAGTPPARSDVQESLEEATGSNLTYVTTAAAFVSEQPGLASGRARLHLPRPAPRQPRR
jgi:hypothetical protein